MTRKAFHAKLRPGQLETYVKAHNPIWPELQAELKRQGVGNYSIFFDPESYSLFGYLEIETEAEFAKLSQAPVCRRWWKEMTALLVCSREGADKADEAELAEVFHLD